MAHPSKLVVVVPGLLTGPKDWESLLSRLKNEPDLLDGVKARWVFWPHNVGVFSFGTIRAIARSLAASINETFETAGPFDEVILVGHSMGGLIVREAYLLASHAYAAEQPPPGRWAAKVRKFVLFAAINRGVDSQSRFPFRLAIAAFKLIGLYERMTLSHLARGSAFVTDLRLAWIRYFRRLAAAGTDPVVVQFVGTIDTLVTREDCLDIEQFPRSETIDIAQARHDDVYRIDMAANPDTRYALIAKVFRPDYLPAIPAVNPVSKEPRRIVFVLHGIRAENTGWIAETIAIINRKDPEALSVAPQYGFFSALHFFLPWVRRSHARWFQDRYSEIAAKYPDPETKFYFIGHSNGTYMLGRSLENVSMMRFERAYLAGSVLPARYPWGKRIESGQIQELRSDGSAWDWPVGLLCSALSFMRDIGTGGFSGFQAAPTKLTECRYYPGGHGKPLEDSENLKAIVDYVLTGADSKPNNLRNEPDYWFGFVSHALRYLGPVILLLVLSLVVFAVLAGGWPATIVVTLVILLILASL